MKALLLVDLQNDFLPTGSLPVPEGNEVIPIANRLMSVFDLVVATQDWHPTDHGSFATNHEGRQPLEQIELDGLPQILWPVHCVQKTLGAELVAELEISNIDHVATKGEDPLVDSYSGFYDNGHRRETDLHAYLQSQGVDRLYVLGLATNFCVKFTVLDALQLGYKVHVIHDACRGVEVAPGAIDAAWEKMREARARIVSSEEVVGEMSV